MTSPRIEQATALANDVLDALAAGALAKVTVTLDYTKVASGARNGVVLIGPPRMTSPTFGQLVPTWELHVISGPADNYLAAWDRIDTILEALSTANLNIDGAEPGQFPLPQGSPVPAYTLTLNE